MTGFGWGLRNLGRHPLRTGLSLAGIAVAAAMLLDMVMLSGGIEKSFSELLLARGYHIRITPKGTFPFDTEAAIPGATGIVRALRAEPGVQAAGAVLGTSVYGGTADSLVTLFGYGVQPEAQGLYVVTAGADLAPGDTAGVLLSEPAARLLRAGIGDTVALVGRLDPQIAQAGTDLGLTVRGTVRWIYDSRGQPSVGTVLPVMQRLDGAAAADRASLLLVKAADDDSVQALAGRLRQRFPELAVNSVADLVVEAKRRLVYFTQLSYVLGGMSLVVAVLLVGTLLTITVNERLGEIATLRAIGVGRRTIVRQVLAEGVALTMVGGGAGILLGLVTAEYLDAILTDFPGLPQAFSFFVPRASTLTVAAVVLLLTGSLAGLYPAWLAASAPIAATLRAEAT
ncbi:MAG TPA: FtsX-like permease family protein [Gemmatimonadales bacterium]|nr:FtsX-like permease family protein [Gemmatimonadales bacterium]